MKNLIAAAVLGLSMTSAASAAILFSDDFSASTPGLNVTPAGWNVSNGRVDVIPCCFGQFDFYPGNNLYIDMDGSTGDAGRITTVATFSAIAGNLYTLAFDFGRNDLNTELLTFGFGGTNGSLTIDGTNTTPGTFGSFSVTFAAMTTGLSSLFFEAPTSFDNQGPVIDNVSLSAVPVPAAGFLLVGALGGLAALRRRKAALAA